jgi:hypothetical protein
MSADHNNKLLAAAIEANDPELLKLVEQQIAADTDIQHPEIKTVPWANSKGDRAKKRVLSLNAWEALDGDDRRPDTGGEGAPVDAPWATFSGGGGPNAPLGAVPTDITGRPCSIQDAEWGRNVDRVHESMTESAENAGRRIVFEAWFEWHQAFYGVADPLDEAKSDVGPKRQIRSHRLRMRMIDSWFAKYLSHPSLTEDEAVILVCEVLVAWAERHMCWRLEQRRENGESLRSLERDTGLSKTTIARLTRAEDDSPNTTGDDMTAETEAALRRIVREENAGLLDEYEARRQARELIPEIEDFLAEGVEQD